MTNFFGRVFTFLEFMASAEEGAYLPAHSTSLPSHRRHTLISRIFPLRKIVTLCHLRVLRKIREARLLACRRRGRRACQARHNLLHSKLQVTRHTSHVTRHASHATHHKSKTLQFQFKTQVSRGKCVRCQQREALMHDEAVEVHDDASSYDQLAVKCLHLPP
jgi:hypothetical protein